jgi:predicted RNase H-like nuclease
MNIFLKLYFDSCKEVYNEINFERITGKQFKYLKAINEKAVPEFMGIIFAIFPALAIHAIWNRKVKKN